jgi:hypothetical protein
MYMRFIYVCIDTCVCVWIDLIGDNSQWFSSPFCSPVVAMKVFLKINFILTSYIGLLSCGLQSYKETFPLGNRFEHFKSFNTNETSGIFVVIDWITFVC